jgi:acetyl-CoA C-acetyltransferase
MVHDGLWDIVNDFHMGYTAELVSEKFQVSRQDQDRFAVESNARAMKATEEGRFREETLAVEMRQKRGHPTVLETDEGPRHPDLEAVSKLKPVFRDGGTVTAGNSSKISDGASALVVMSMKRAKESGLSPMGVVGTQAAAGVELEDILVAPMKSIPKALKKSGLSTRSIDVFEINEAFAASTVAVIRELELDPDRVNIRGGAIALGHPIGASGARVLTTLLYAMRDEDAKVGMASLCLGGGEAVSLIVER